MIEQYAKILTLYDKWLEEQSYSINTKEPYLRIVKSFLAYLNSFGVTDLKDVNSKLLTSFITNRSGKQYAKAYIKLREVSIALFYGWAYQNKFCQNNPMLNLRIEKLRSKPFSKRFGAKNDQEIINILEPYEQEQLLEGISKSAKNDFEIARNTCIVKLILGTGIYAAELIALELKDLNTITNTLKIRGAKTRTVSITPEIMSACEKWQNIRKVFAKRNKIGSLFITKKLNPLYKRILFRIISKAMEKAGLAKKHTGADILRQSAICNMLRSGMPLEEVQKITEINSFECLKKYKELVQDN